MKRLFLFITCSIVLQGFATGKDLPGGGITRSKLSFLIPVNFVSNFIKAPRPDSAIFILRRTVFQPGNPDSTSFRDMLRNKIDGLSYKSTGEDYKKIISTLIELNNYNCFRLFYHNTERRIYKFLDYHPDGTLIREVILVDPATGLLEITNYYKNDLVLSRSQQKSFPPVKAENRDSLWYGLTPYLKKSGNHSVFYPDGTLKSQRYFENGIMIRVVKDTVIKKDLFGNNLNYGQRKALLIGIDEYAIPAVSGEKYRPVRRPEAVYNSLDGCVNDVNGIAEVFVSHQGFTNSNITRLTDDAGTRTGILSAFGKFSRSLKKGDFVFIHYSGMSNDVKRAGTDHFEYALVCRDWYMADSNRYDNGFIFRRELDSLFNSIKSIIGKEGQLVFSLDASGAVNTMKKDDGVENDPASFRGESNNLLFNITNKNEAPFTFMSAASPGELGQEMKDEKDSSYGAYSLALINVLKNREASTIFDLHSGIVERLRLSGKRQSPQYYSNFNQLLFESTLLSGGQKTATLPIIKQSGSAHAISVGISRYPSASQLKFSNCVNDAVSYAAFFQSQFNGIGGEKKLRSYLLTDSMATKDGILKAINETISNSKPEDYFIFNFSGYCKPLSDSTGKKVTYFVPYGLKSITDTNEIKKEGIPLVQLKDLLQLIPANNQLFITEAGSTDAFQKEFIQALIETSPTIAALSNKNRIFMVPRSSGLDKFYCNNIPVEHGPLNYFITHLSNELNFFGLFENGVYADAVKYAISRTEVGCDYFKSGYFDIFFEKEYLKDLQYYLPEETMKSRGGIGTNVARDELAAGNSKRYALVMGTNQYEATQDWDPLENATLDAEEIATELRQGFGYDVKLLLDQPIDSFYGHIAYLSRILKRNDQLIIYVAGHGDFDSMLLDDGFIVGRYSKPVKEDPYRNTYIQHTKLEKMVNRLPANQVLVILDVCFGGTFDERVARNEGRNRNTEYEDISDKSFFAEKLKIKTRLLLTSGGKDVVPDGYKGQHSPFALRLLQALNARGGSSKVLTAADLHKFVKKLPSGPLLGSFGDNNFKSEFLLLAN